MSECLGEKRLFNNTCSSFRGCKGNMSNVIYDYFRYTSKHRNVNSTRVMTSFITRSPLVQKVQINGRNLLIQMF